MSYIAFYYATHPDRPGVQEAGMLYLAGIFDSRASADAAVALERQGHVFEVSEINIRQDILLLAAE